MEPVPTALQESPERPAGARVPGMSRELQSRWLLELERAQLAQGSRLPRTGGPSAALAANGARTFARARNAAAPAASPASPPREAAAMEQRARAKDAPAREFEQPVVRSREQALNAPADREARPARDAAKTAPAEPLPRARRPVPVTWPRVNVHARWNGSGVEVWVRDASLDSAQRLQLAARLRAQVHHLVRLTVNGDEIDYEENTAWPSKP